MTALTYLVLLDLLDLLDLDGEKWVTPTSTTTILPVHRSRLTLHR